MVAFLRSFLLLASTTVLLFVITAALSGQIRALQWLLFQPAELFNVDGHTVAGIDAALASGEQGGLLVVGNSVCRNSINPTILSEQLGMRVVQTCTGAQSMQGALAVAQFLSERLQPDAVLLDLYVREQENAVEEGVLRVLLATPDARTEFARFSALEIDGDWNSTYLWARAWVASWFNDSPPAPSDTPPGFVCASGRPPMPTATEQRAVPVDSITTARIARAAKELHTGQFFVNIPPQHGVILQLDAIDGVIPLPSGVWPDSCLFDSHHQRCECSAAYTLDLAQRMQEADDVTHLLRNSVP